MIEAGESRGYFLDLVVELCTRRDITQVVHFAAESHVDRSITGSGDFIETNIVGTYRLLEATRAHLAKLSSSERSRFRFVHVSTDEVYGSLDAAGRFVEDTPYQPNSPYSASKAASDVAATVVTPSFATVLAMSIAPGIVVPLFW